MIRILVFLAVIAALAFGVGWLVDRPGSVSLVWEGWQVETTVPVLIFAVVVFTAAVMILLALLRTIIDIPDAVSHFLHGRRRKRGMNAIARGLVAVGVGDAKAARRSANDARRFVGDEPLTLLLRAQAAQLSGDRTAAEDAFRSMLEAPETLPLGYRGLFVEARRRGDREEARRIADQSLRATPDVPWAGPALLELQSADSDWDAALATVERNRANKVIDKDVALRQRAVLLTAKAQTLVETQPEEARRLAREAAKLAPGLVPAAALAGRLLGEAGDYRKASRLVEAAWRINPHPDLAWTYINIRPGDAAFDRLKRARKLADQAYGNDEGALILAQAAIDARDFDAARAALEPLTAGVPTRRVCLLMAELEDADTGDRGRARAWLARAVAARRDTAWVADGVILDHWEPVSPVTGQLDAFTWTVPQESLAAPESRVLEAEMDAQAAAPLLVDAPALDDNEPEAVPASPEDEGLRETLAEPAELPEDRDLERKDEALAINPEADTPVTPEREPVPPVEDVPRPAEEPPPPPKPEEKSSVEPAPNPAKAEPGPVLPLPRAPDDPGPDADDGVDPDAPRIRQTIPGGP